MTATAKLELPTQARLALKLAPVPTLAERLKAKGWDVKICHLRLELTEAGEVVFIGMHQVPKNNRLLPRGGVTMAQLTPPKDYTGPGGTNVHVGIAFCAFKDSFCYKAGAATAIDKALTSYDAKPLRRRRARTLNPATKKQERLSERRTDGGVVRHHRVYAKQEIKPAGTKDTIVIPRDYLPSLAQLESLPEMFQLALR